MMKASHCYLRATHIHDGHGWLPEGSVIEHTLEGTITAVHPPGVIGDAAFYEGVIAPGFVNAHCHLELSHMKGMVPEATGLVPFLQAIPTHRNDFTDEQKKAARLEAYAELVRNGIVAVGDIANSTETLDLRLLPDLHLHTFVECIGFTEAFAQARLDYSQQVLSAFAAQRPVGRMLRQSLIPHAPYSVSPPLFRLINEAAPGSIISIHNQESPAEDEYYRHKTGAVRLLLAGLGVDDAFFVPTGKASIQSYLPYFSSDHPMLLVHNTCTTAEDVVFAQSRANRLYWCLCPNANRYIERTLPDVQMLTTHTDAICIGTDSLASNHRLSVLGELQTLSQHFDFLTWEELLRWGTLNGARALGMDNLLGSIEPGKQPGLIHIPDLAAPVVTRIL